jgi:hypothetical protein
MKIGGKRIRLSMEEPELEEYGRKVAEKMGFRNLEIKVSSNPSLKEHIRVKLK